MQKVCSFQEINEKSTSVLAKELKINYRTAKSLKRKVEMKDILAQVKIDRALREFLFSCPAQVKLFDYLITDLNFFNKFDDVKKVIPISRYHYNKVKIYIQEEL